MSYSITIAGGDLDELKTNLSTILEQLGAGGEGGGTGDGDTGDVDTGGDDLLGGDEGEAVDPLEALREACKTKIVAAAKKPENVEKIKAALAKVKAKKFGDVTDKMLPAFAKLIGVKA